MVKRLTSVEVLLDRYSPTSYHYATPKLGHLAPFKCPVTRPKSNAPSRSLEAHTNIAYPYLTVISISVAHCKTGIHG